MSKLKLMTIIGTRPEIIRLAAVIKKADKAARFITVILPFGNAADFDSQEVTAAFIDNPNPENAGTFHGNDGAAVKVTVNGKDYSLAYNLN